MKDCKCSYCGNEEALSVFGEFVCELTNSNLYIFKEQSHKGRVIVAYKEHVDDFTDLSDEERNGFFADVNLVSKALKALYNPTKVNYGMYNDKGHHLHCHLVPKYENDEFEFGSTFEMNPKRTYFSEAEFENLKNEIKNEVNRMLSK